jgi:hypothetical protein
MLRLADGLGRSWGHGVTWLERGCCNATPYGLNVFYADSFSQLFVSTVYRSGVGWGTHKFAFQVSVSYFCISCILYNTYLTLFSVAHSFLRSTVFYAIRKVGVPHALGDTVYD